MATIANITESQQKTGGLTGKALLEKRKRDAAAAKKVAEADKAQKALKESAERGAFDISKATTKTAPAKTQAQLISEAQAFISPAEQAKRDKEQAAVDARNAEQEAAIAAGETTAAGTTIRPGEEPALVEAGEIQESIFGETTTPTGLEQQVERLTEQQKAEREAFEDQKRRTEEIEASQFAQAQRGTRAAVAGAESAFAQGREGVVGSSAPEVIRTFKEESSANLTRARLSVESAAASRERLETQLLEAQRDKKETVAIAIQEQLSRARAAETKAQEKLDQTNADIEQAGLKLRKDALDSFSDMPAGAFETLTALDISDLFGIDGSTASILKSLDTQRSALQEDDPEFQLKQASLDVKLSELKTAGLTQAQRNFTFAQSLTGSDRDSFLNFAGKNPTFQSIKVGEDVYAFDPDTGRTTKVVDNTGRNFLVPSGELTTNTVNGRQYTLDNAAMTAFVQANEMAISSGVGPILTQSTNTASFRSVAQQQGLFGQGRTVAQVLSEGSMTPERASEVARPDLPRVTNTANKSAHMSGLALDIKADKEYIESIRPFLEANGYTQTALAIGDFGHFSFQGGVRKISNEARSLSKQIDRLEIEFDEIEDDDLRMEVSMIRAGMPLSKKEKDDDLNDIQGKSLIFANRMKQASDVINQFDDQFFKVGSKNPLNLIGLVPFVDTPNLFLSKEQQQVNQAQRNFVNAVLRKESGAAISEGEFDSAIKQYFRQVGDSQTVIKQKKENRDLALALMMEASGRTEFEDGTTLDAFKNALTTKAALTPTLDQFGITDTTDEFDLLIDSN